VPGPLESAYEGSAQESMPWKATALALSLPWFHRSFDGDCALYSQSFSDLLFSVLATLRLVPSELYQYFLSRILTDSHNHHLFVGRSSLSRNLEAVVPLPGVGRGDGRRFGRVMDSI
jgi:hypothetical protein